MKDIWGIHLGQSINYIARWVQTKDKPRSYFIFIWGWEEQLAVIFQVSYSGNFIKIIFVIVNCPKLNIFCIKIYFSSDNMILGMII